MDDREMNPMKTGLMFVPLGLVMLPGCPVARQSPHRPTDLEVAEALEEQNPIVVPQASCQSIFRRLLERVWRIQQRNLPSPT